MIDSNTQAWVTAAQHHTDLDHYNIGEEILLISPHCVMHSAAGYYIGQVCTEFEWADETIDYKCDGYWIPQPWARNTEYMKEKEAYRMLEQWEQEDPGTTILSPDHKPTMTAINTEETT